jgi:hypothetical protein
MPRNIDKYSVLVGCKIELAWQPLSAVLESGRENLPQPRGADDLRCGFVTER